MNTPDEQDARAELEDVRARIAELPNALALAAQLNEQTIESSSLDLRAFHLVRLAALAASGAPPIAWRINLEVMEDHVSVDDVDGVLAAIAPIIGTARYLDAVKSIIED